MTEALSEWLQTAMTAAGVTKSGEFADQRVVNMVLDLARDAAHNVTRPAAPLATFALGFAVASRLTIDESLIDELAAVAARISAATVSSATVSASATVEL